MGRTNNWKQVHRKQTKYDWFLTLSSHLINLTLNQTGFNIILNNSKTGHMLKPALRVGLLLLIWWILIISKDSYKIKILVKQFGNQCFIDFNKFMNLPKIFDAFCYNCFIQKWMRTLQFFTKCKSADHLMIKIFLTK